MLSLLLTPYWLHHTGFSFYVSSGSEELPMGTFVPSIKNENSMLAVRLQGATYAKGR
jgi:hypothetical protein